MWCLNTKGVSIMIPSWYNTELSYASNIQLKLTLMSWLFLLKPNILSYYLRMFALVLYIYHIKTIADDLQISISYILLT